MTCRSDDKKRNADKRGAIPFLFSLPLNNPQNHVKT
nr:MAG TPA: hypothetical protein [Caudoviricetes sp.]